MLRSLWVGRRLALLASVAFVGSSSSVVAQTFTVTSGTTDITPKTLTGTQTGTVDAGGTLRSTSGTTTVTFNTNASPMNVILTNFGIIENTGSGRATNTNNTAGQHLGVTFFNNAGAIMRASQQDAFRISATAPGAGSFVTIDNAGLIQAGGTGPGALGNAIDLRPLDSANVTINVINRATGIIEALTTDAFRPGRNAVVENFGIIRSFGANTGSGGDVSDAFDSGDITGVTVINRAGGLISGARHGVNGNASNTVINEAGATIIGRNGSGIGSDGGGTVTNFGTITGAYAGAGNIFLLTGAASVNGDGDGIDIDLAATITNHGIIQGTGAGGFDNGGRANNSEGISIGGGSIVNFGTITGATRGIIVNNDTNPDRSGVAATTITNNVGGSIIGQNGFAIRLENKGAAPAADTIVNHGTIVGNGTIPDPNAIVLLESGAVDTNSTGTLDGVVYTGTGVARFIRGDGSAIQMGEGSDVLTNHSVITGNTGRAINMEGGSDTVNIHAGSRITGLVNGGTGTDTLNYNKVGLTEAHRAALQAGQTVNIGGTLYTSFEVVNGAAQSFSSFAVGGGVGVANLLDNLPNTAGASASVVALIDSVASAPNVASALNQLSPSSLQGLTTFSINNAFMVTSMVTNRLNDIRQGGLNVDMSGAATAIAMFNNNVFAGNRTVGAERLHAQINSHLAPELSAFANPSEGYAQNPALAAFARGASAEGGAFKARPPAVIESNGGLFVSSGILAAREGARVDAPATKYTTASFAAGVDKRLNDNWIAGVFLGFSRTNGDLDANGSTTKIGTVFGGGYATYDARRWYANAIAVYGHSNYDTQRIALGTVNTSSPDGDQFALQGTVGTDIHRGAWWISPEVGAQFTHVRVAGYTEAGGAAALRIDEDHTNSLRTNVGVRVRYQWAMAWGMLTPEWRAAWQHEFLNGTRDLRSSFVDIALPGSFATTTGAPGRDFGLLGASLAGRFATSTNVSLNYDVIFGRHDFVSHLVTARLKHTY